MNDRRVNTIKAAMMIHKSKKSGYNVILYDE